MSEFTESLCMYVHRVNTIYILTELVKCSKWTPRAFRKADTRLIFKSTVFWNITPCNTFKVNRFFGGTYRLYLQDQINTCRHQSSRQTGRSVRPSLNNNFFPTLSLLSTAGPSFRKLYTGTFEPKVQIPSSLLSEVFCVGHDLPKDLCTFQEVHFYI